MKSRLDQYLEVRRDFGIPEVGGELRSDDDDDQPDGVSWSRNARGVLIGKAGKGRRTETGQMIDKYREKFGRRNPAEEGERAGGKEASYHQAIYRITSQIEEILSYMQDEEYGYDLEAIFSDIRSRIQGY